MNVIEAMTDPAVFGPVFRGPSWAAWRAFLASLFGLPLDQAEMALYRHHTGREVAPVVPFKEAALVCGRRGGKSRILALLGAYLATFVDYSDRLAPGEVASVVIVAADRLQAKIIHRYLIALLRLVPMLAALIEGETQDSVTLTNRVTISVVTNSHRTVRGTTVVAALCDELAFWRSEESANPDFDVLAALRPGLATLGGLLLMASSPYAKKGALYAAFRDGWAADDSDVLVWKGTSREMNPLLPQSVVDKAMAADPANALAEYMAEWRSGIAAWIDPTHIEAVTFPGRYEMAHRHGQAYVAFCDPSGGVSDSMTMGIAHREGDVGVLDCIRVRRAPFSPDDVVAEFAATLASYGIRSVHGDRYGGTWPSAAFGKAGVSYVPSELPKSPF